MTFPRTRRCVLGLAVFAGLAACTSTTTGRPAPEGTAPEGTASVGLTAEAFLGDFATYDPCDLVEPTVFEEFGAAADAGSRSFEQCGLTLTTESGMAVVSVGRLGRLDDYPKVDQRIMELDGDLRIVRWPGDSEACRHGLVFTDDVTLEVVVTGATSVDLCAVADTGVRAVADSVRAGPVDHHDYPANSLALRDPCDLVSDDTVRARPAFVDARRMTAPARHSCEWFHVADGVATTLSVTFGLGSPPVAGTSDEEIDLAGRPTVVSRLDGETGTVLCAVSTAHELAESTEWAEVNTYAPAERESGCDSAVAVATEVWEKLPKR